MYIMITYKFNILKELKEMGYSTYRIRKEKILAESVIQALREGKGISFSAMNTICTLLDYQPGNLLRYTPDNEHNT